MKEKRNSEDEQHFTVKGPTCDRRTCRITDVSRTRADDTAADLQEKPTSVTHLPESKAVVRQIINYGNDDSLYEAA